LLQFIEAARTNDCARLIDLLRTLVTGYAPTGAMHDLVWIARGMPGKALPADDASGKVMPLPARRSRPGDQTIP
jgi:hypothetical protein